MAQKPKARSSKKKTVPKEKASDEKQFERFIKTAHDLGIDESGKEFEKAIKTIVSKRH